VMCLQHLNHALFAFSCQASAERETAMITANPSAMIIGTARRISVTGLRRMGRTSAIRSVVGVIRERPRLAVDKAAETDARTSGKFFFPSR